MMAELSGVRPASPFGRPAEGTCDQNDAAAAVLTTGQALAATLSRSSRARIPGGISHDRSCRL